MIHLELLIYMMYTYYSSAGNQGQPQISNVPRTVGGQFPTADQDSRFQHCRLESESRRGGEDEGCEDS